MKDFKILKFLDKFKGIFEKLGVDYDVMRNILQVKLIMDGRRIPTIMSNSKRRSQDIDEDKNKFVGSLWIYALYGLIVVPFVLGRNNYMLEMSIAFGIIIFIVMTSLISDFSSVLLDVRDINIIHSKPVSAKTINIAKILHVLIYMCMLTLAVAGPALIVSLVRQGLLFFIIFFLELVLMDLFIVVLTALLYMLILRFFDGEKLKDIINYIQIILSITLAVGYQLIARLFDFSGMNMNAAFIPKWWQYFIIPVWFAAPFDILVKGVKNYYNTVFSLLALIVPVISIITYSKLSPVFERNLEKLNNNSSKAKRNRKLIKIKISDIICKSKEEKVFYEFTSDMIKNEREFKLKVYPSLGFSMVFPFIFIFNSMKDIGLSSIASGKSYLNIYFCATMVPTIIMMMKYSSRYKGAWIYKALPIKSKASIYKGALKAFIVKLILPVYIAEGIIFTLIFKVRIIPDLITVFLNIILFTVLCFKFMKKAFPFSMAMEDSNHGGGMLMIPLMMLLGVMVVIHYASTFVSWGIYLYMAVLFILNIFLWDILTSKEEEA